MSPPWVCEFPANPPFPKGDADEDSDGDADEDPDSKDLLVDEDSTGIANIFWVVEDSVARVDDFVVVVTVVVVTRVVVVLVVVVVVVVTDAVVVVVFVVGLGLAEQVKLLNMIQTNLLK